MAKISEINVPGIGRVRLGDYMHTRLRNIATYPRKAVARARPIVTAAERKARAYIAAAKALISAVTHPDTDRARQLDTPNDQHTTNNHTVPVSARIASRDQVHPPGPTQERARDLDMGL